MVGCEHEIEFLQDDAKIASYQTWDRYKITRITKILGNRVKKLLIKLAAENGAH